MKISYNWLSQYTDIPENIRELADKLTMAGIEVEAIEAGKIIPDGIIIAEILERKPHPDADKLSVCRVNTGSEELQIVCGAPNCDAGVKAPLATLGTVLEDDETGKKITIKKAKLRGVESSGMLCSARELGIQDDHSGIMHLPKDASVGAPLNSIIKSDTVFDLEITPNRPDLLSHWGIARDISALMGTTLRFPDIKIPAVLKAEAAKYKDSVEVLNKGLCPRYTARIVKGIKVKESPEWLKERIQSIGLRPINNIVDITNFILMELGHPLHAFDLAELKGQKIIVRTASDGETMMTLDGKTHKLKSSHLVIADAEKPVALAGIMGGEHSGVTDKTVDILIESAVFFPPNIRASSRELGISSDSSYRFERGVDFEMAEAASNRAVSLILELAGGEIVSDLIDVKAPEREMPAPINCRFSSIRKLLGTEIDNQEIVEIFKRLGLEVSEINENSCRVDVPSYRLDIEREADLGEEVARIYGLDKIPALPVNAKMVSSLAEDAYLKLETAKNELISLGLCECMNYSMSDEKSAVCDGKFTKEDLVELKNPISSDFAYMRPSLFSGILDTVRRNISRKNLDLELFETGVVFCANKNLYPEERRECCIVLSGRKHPERFSSEKNETYDFFDMKGLLEKWLEHRRLENTGFRKADDPRFEKGSCAEIIAGGKYIGSFGMLAGNFTRGMRTQYPVYLAVIQLDVLLGLKDRNILYEPLSMFPSVARDVAFVADESLSHDKIVEFIMRSKPENLEKVELFDIFRDENIGKNKKSMAYSLTFRNSARTLTDEEVNKAHEKLRSQLASGLSVDLR
ncbi:MAG: phenylalanine--tRNA ligase subunit beta [Lentisphaerae bacterium GWF2_44_16]|nr:MAG: phenylalanine--tRNA ligase subunit beta [Lentisphaerae bacterium GWF2_44_16]